MKSRKLCRARHGSIRCALCVLWRRKDQLGSLATVGSKSSSNRFCFRDCQPCAVLRYVQFKQRQPAVAKLDAGNAKHSPTTRRVADVAERVSRLEEYERWRSPIKVDFEAILERDAWEGYWLLWHKVNADLANTKMLLILYAVNYRRIRTQIVGSPIYLRLVWFDIVGKNDTPPLLLKGESHQANSRKEFRGREGSAIAALDG